MASKTPARNAGPEVGIPLILSGLVLIVVLSPRLDGFFRGMAIGGGLSIVLLSVYAMAKGGALGRRAAGDDDLWLPSEDEER